MFDKIKSQNLNRLLTLAFCLIFSSSALANAENSRLVERDLSRKLQADLSDSRLAVKLNNVEERRISEDEIELAGSGIVTGNADTLPISFEAKVNSASRLVSDIKYEFLDAVADFAPAENEEVLMKELMGKISRDYKTQNIVIAIDGFENVGNTADGRKFLGIGEVRIGDMVWNKIKFDVVIDEKTQRASSVVYKVEK